MTPNVRKAATALALLATLAGVAWLLLHRGTKTLRVAFILTHVEARVGGTTLGPGALREVRVVAREGPTVLGAVTLPARGEDGRAAAVSAPVEIAVSRGAPEVEVTCRFGPASGTAGVETRTKVRLDPARTDVQTADIGRCQDRQ